MSHPTMISPAVTLWVELAATGRHGPDAAELGRLEAELRKLGTTEVLREAARTLVDLGVLLKEQGKEVWSQGILTVLERILPCLEAAQRAKGRTLDTAKRRLRQFEGSRSSLPSSAPKPPGGIAAGPFARFQLHK